MFDDGERNKSHKYFIHSTTKIKGRLPFAALLLIKNYIRSKNQSDKQWKEDKSLRVAHWTKNEIQITSKPITYSIIFNYIKSRGEFNPAEFELPFPTADFIDVSTNIGMAVHTVDSELKPTRQIYTHNTDTFLGEKYPIQPVLCREGISLTSFFDNLIRRIYFSRIALVEKSNECFTFEWIFALRDIINDSIASIEITLNLIYNKAQFDPLPGWQFDPAKLGSKYGRRFKDKLKWIYQISGNLFNIELYKNSITLLQELRNHLNHFDPPNFCLTFEECAEILNAILDVGMVHLEMRKTMGLSFSISLVNLVLLPSVVFTPEQQFAKRAPLLGNEGYNSCRWLNPTSTNTP